MVIFMHDPSSWRLVNEARILCKRFPTFIVCFILSRFLDLPLGSAVRHPARLLPVEMRCSSALVGPAKGADRAEVCKGNVGNVDRLATEAVKPVDRYKVQDVESDRDPGGDLVTRDGR